jgi:hypothetical protein
MKNLSILKIIFLISLSAFMFSCSDVLDNTYSKKTAEGDLERIMAIRRLDSTDYTLMTNYMLKQGLIEPDLMHIDQTYKQLLETARRDKMSSERMDKKLKGNKGQFQMDQLDHLYDALIMLPEQSTIRKDWSNRSAFFYKMVFVNPSNKAIRAFKGKFTFYDLFDTELKSISFTYNDTIPPLDTLIYDANIEFGNLNANSIYFTKNYSDLKVIWRPTKVLYTDGTFAE